MWSRIKKKIYDFFIVETIETIEEPTHPTHKTKKETQPKSKPKSLNRLHQQKSSIETRMTYKYPERSFRFPLIPDDPHRENHSAHTFHRREERALQNESLDLMEDYHHGSSPSVNPIRPLQQEEKKKPFTPTQVASPIYGYQKREDRRDIEKVPAYIRRQIKEQDDEQIPNQSNKFSEPHQNVGATLEPTRNSHSSVTDMTVNDSEKETHVQNIDCDYDEKKNVETAQEDTAFASLTARNEIGVNDQIKDENNQSNHKQRDDDHELTHKKNQQKVRQTIHRTNHQHIQTRKRRKSSSHNGKKPIPYNVMMTPFDKKKLRDKQLSQQDRHHRDQSYQVPYHLLNDPIHATSEDRRWVRDQQRLLEQTLKHFNVKANVVHATQGPTVTRFEVKPDLGVKVSRVRNLSDDIKLNMAAKDIRIEAPIPGKNTIGIEVPNLNAQMVGLQEIFATHAFKYSKDPLTIGLGLNVEGQPLVTTISKMPHGLIAGATGSGKSVCINTILISLLYKESHEDLKLLLIDPKMVELAPYNGIPHLISPVITDIKAATAALKWAVDEMEERYEKFVQEGVRDIQRYNAKMISEQRTDEKMPYMVIVIDELADLMMVSPQDVEDAICRIAQKARACGMHLLLATQRPSVDVITGLIKANIPTRIAFSVSSQVDSRTIIDTNGAEKLLGKGDMLFIENGSGKSVRLQGAFVSDEEIERVTHYVRQIASPNYLFEQEQLIKQIEVDEEEDELFIDAIQFILEQNSASTSMLQRQFRIGYNRAARLIDTLENKGIISSQNGSKPRDVLMTKTELEDLLSSRNS